MKKSQQKIGVLALFASKAGLVPLSNLIEILSTLSDSIYVIAGNEAMNLPHKKNQKIEIFGVRCGFKGNIFNKIINYISIQLIFSSKIIKLTKDVNIWVFFTGTHALLLPMIAAKLMRKKIVFALVSSIKDISKAQKNTFFNILVYNVLIYSEDINYKLSNHIILYSPNLIKEWNLEKYRNKISIAHEHSLDFDKFKVTKTFDERIDLIGYIGRLSEEKGVLNFVKAIPEISKRKSHLEFLIGGDGQLRDGIKEYFGNENLNDKVKLAGWISHDELPNYMNELKLLVLPSHTEGLPNIMLEAMACGTPVLATPVGAIPDVIKDGETGFIMENNSPECIAENVIRALNHLNLGQTAQNARALVEREYTYEKAVEGYRNILEELL
ncbi:glycosyltransferase family 4 protein [Dehalococcoidia bacterium]|nr:glycosyltransferase family 4 protein [Dehalococcoidia bacterium]